MGFILSEIAFWENYSRSRGGARVYLRQFGGMTQNLLVVYGTVLGNGRQGNTAYSLEGDWLERIAYVDIGRRYIKDNLFQLELRWTFDFINEKLHIFDSKRSILDNNANVIKHEKHLQQYLIALLPYWGIGLNAAACLLLAKRGIGAYPSTTSREIILYDNFFVK